MSEANERVERGERLFRAGDYDAALAEFERAYEVIGENPGRYVILYNIGRAHERRFRYDLAMRYFRRYLEEGGQAAPLRPQVEAKIEALEGLLATVHVRIGGSAARAEVWIDDRQVGDAPGDVLIPAGRHVLEVRARGYETAQREIQIAPRTEQTVAVSLSAFGEGLRPTWFWIATTVSAVTLAGGAALGVTALVRDAELGSQARDLVTADGVDFDAENRAIRTLAVAADILFASSALFGVTALVLALFTDYGGRPDTRSRSHALRVAPLGRGLVLEASW